jgi:adenine phosphoribosyltransferase
MPSHVSDSQLADLVRRHLRDVPDFPEPGILFKDIAPLLADGPAFGAASSALAEFGRSAAPVDLVAGVEARGFVFAGAIARDLDCGLVPVRKAGKLPPPTIMREYALEYGTASIEVPVNVLAGKRELLVDDVLATGGTLVAGHELVETLGGVVVGTAVLMELTALGGREVVGDVHTVFTA